MRNLLADYVRQLLGIGDGRFRRGKKRTEFLPGFSTELRKKLPLGYLTTKKRLSGKNALITGGSMGIGLATAKLFVDEGAYVFITGRREPELNAAVKEIGENVTGVQGDVANLGDLDRLFAQIKREKGTLDIVFANLIKA